VNVEWAEIIPLKTDKQEDPDDQIRYTVDVKSVLKVIIQIYNRYTGNCRGYPIVHLDIN
jgi:hypothetical protein